MKRLMHIILLLALYNICCFCLKLSLPLIAVMVGAVFFVTAWIGMFLALTRIIIVMLESNKHELNTK